MRSGFGLGSVDHVIPPALQEQMSERAGAYISNVEAATCRHRDARPISACREGALATASGS